MSGILEAIALGLCGGAIAAVIGISLRLEHWQTALLGGFCGWLLAALLS
jgi:hypothetical protein